MNIFRLFGNRKKAIENHDKNANITFTKDEYNSLRTEIITRIQNINNQSHTAILTIISAWTAGIALFALLFKGIETIKQSIWIIDAMNSFIFLIPIIYFIPLSIKSGENLTQIASISAYIKVFYEYLPNDETSKFNWEITNSLFSNINVDRGKKSNPYYYMNEEYTVLSISSLILYLFRALYAIINIKAFYSNFCLIIAVHIYIIIFLLFSIICVINHFNSCIKRNMMNKNKLYIESYINRAVALGIIDQNQIIHVKNELIR